MATLESQIDDLYRAALSDFIAMRAALAKSQPVDAAKLVRKLVKPTVVPWAINQVYWRARPLYDRLMTSGDELRRAQVAALEGRRADVRAAADAHRQATAAAAQKAGELAARDGLHPAPDVLQRTLEALSLAERTGDAPGRLTKPSQPAGFEALAGVKIAAKVSDEPKAGRVGHLGEEDRGRNHAPSAADKRQEAARKKREAEVKRAEAALERARQRMADAEAVLKRTRNRTS